MHCTDLHRAAYGDRMRADDTISDTPIRHGAYVCLTEPPAGLDVPALAAGLGLRNEFEHPDTDLAVAYVRRESAGAGAVADDGLLGAAAVVHVAAPTAEPVAEFCAAFDGRIPGARVLGGVVRPPRYTGREMF